ncbi:MAG: hypothetical protein ABIQ73_08255 [Acidimicrobiales bacterium]
MVLACFFAAPAFAQVVNPPPPPPIDVLPSSTTRPATTTTLAPTTTEPPATTEETTTTVRRTTITTTRAAATTVPTTVAPQLVVASSTTILRAPSAVVSAPTTTIDKVINSSAGSKVRSAVRSLEIIAGATAVLTLLYWWNTRPRRRVKVAERKAQQREALTQEAREIYATAVAGTSVFADADAPTGELVVANGSRGDAPSRDDLPLAARLPRAMSGTGAVAQSPAELTEGVPFVAAEPTKGSVEAAPRRPNPRPAPRRNRAMRSRQSPTGDAIVKDDG